MPRPDISIYLAHFTADRSPLITGSENPASRFSTKSAREKLVSILEEKIIYESLLPYANVQAVCFTECPWMSLLEHSERYSPYGIGFNKQFIFAAGGGPVFYVKPDIWEAQSWVPSAKAFTTPFIPYYTPPKHQKPDFKIVDYSHEREWRIPHKLTFTYDKIQFVIVNSYEDMQYFDDSIVAAVGKEKFLFMDVYRAIEKLWPMHII